MDNRVCIITGSNSGIGKETAIGLARLGAHIVMVCQSRNRGEAAKADIIKESGNNRVDLFISDLSEMAQVRTLAEELLDSLNEIHVLIHNAGMANVKRETTTEGLETSFAVNQLAPFLLTHLLLKRIQESAPARIIMVTSGLHGKGRVEFDNLQAERQFSALGAYASSKLMNVMFTYSLARLLDGTGVTSNVIHPGIVATGLARRAALPLRLMMKLIGASPKRGARSPIFAASEPSLQTVSGTYINRNCQTKQSAPQSYDRDVQDRLWRACTELAKISERDS